MVRSILLTAALLLVALLSFTADARETKGKRAQDVRERRAHMMAPKAKLEERYSKPKYRFYSNETESKMTHKALAGGKFLIQYRILR